MISLPSRYYTIQNHNPSQIDKLVAFIERYRTACPDAKLLSAGLYAYHPAVENGLNVFLALDAEGQVRGFAPLFPAPVSEESAPTDPHHISMILLADPEAEEELATPEEQEHVIRMAAISLDPGGYVFVDNNHMEGGLAPSWQQPGVRSGFPSGTCADGTRVESTTETIWSDIPARLVKFRRKTLVYLPGSGDTPHRPTVPSATASRKVIEVAYIQQKHPVSKYEVQTWLEKYGFIIE